MCGQTEQGRDVNYNLRMIFMALRLLLLQGREAYMQAHHIPLKDLTIDVGLMLGMFFAIFAFGVAALPYMPGELVP